MSSSGGGLPSPPPGSRLTRPRPLQARHESKLALRRPLLDRLAACRDKDTDNFVNFVSTEPVQKGLGKYLASLSKKADA